MKNIFFDLRGQSLRVLATDDKTVPMRKSYDVFSPSDADRAAEVLADVERETGGKLAQVHVILPAEQVTTSIQRVPLMSRADAEKVIRRKIIKETGQDAPVFSIVPLGSSVDKQEFLAETIDREALSLVAEFFRDRGIRVRTATTSLHANLRSMKTISSDPTQAVALIDLEKDHIELIVTTGVELMFYEKMPVPVIDTDKELQSGKSAERIEKMKVYRFVEAVYSLTSTFQKDRTDTPLTKFWVTGPGGALTGIIDVLKESLNAEVAPLVLPGAAEAQGVLFTGLEGLALSLHEGGSNNYLPKDMAGRLPLARSVRFTMAAVYCAVLLAIIAAVQINYGRTRTLLADREQATRTQVQPEEDSAPYIQNRQLLTRTIRSQASPERILAYLADNTPDGVYVGGMTYLTKQEPPLLEIDFVMPSVSDVGDRKLLSKIIAMTDRYRGFRRRGEPVITITKQGQGDGRLLHAKVLCEVMNNEKVR